MTPLIQRKTQDRRKQKQCKLCNTDTQEKEEHIFLRCPTFTPTRQTLKFVLDRTTNEDIDIDLAITLIKIPRHPNRRTHDLNLLTLAVYKQHIWSIYLKTRNDQYIPPKPDLIEEIYRHKLDLRINKKPHSNLHVL